MISERKLVKLIKKNYKGYKLSLRKLAENYNGKFDEFYPVIKSLGNKGIVKLNEIGELGREGPVDVIIEEFNPPHRNILQHPLVEKLVYFLLGILIMLVANYIWDKLKK